MGDIYIVDMFGNEQKATNNHLEKLQGAKFERVMLGQPHSTLNREPRDVNDYIDDMRWLAKHLAKQT